MQRLMMPVVCERSTSQRSYRRSARGTDLVRDRLAATLITCAICVSGKDASLTLVNFRLWTTLTAPLPWRRRIAHGVGKVDGSLAVLQQVAAVSHDES